MEPTTTTKTTTTGVISPATSTVQTEEGTGKTKNKSWNTRNLGLRIAADGAAAATAGVLVAPLITMIDRAIMEKASGRSPHITTSLQTSLHSFLRSPPTFLLSRPFLLVFSLYTTTYLTANTLDTVSSTLTPSPASTTTSGIPKFLATSTANLSVCLYKDSQFTRLFGPQGAAPRPVGPGSYALFAARDCLTIFASFNLPPLLAPHLPLSQAAQKHVSALSAAQFLAPAALQLVSTPLHLLGLDLYNRGEVGWGERWRQVRKGWLGSSFARMGRIMPAFGVGGVVNTGVRARLMGRLE